MRITNRTIGYIAEKINNEYIIKDRTILEQFSKLERIKKSTKVTKYGKEIFPVGNFWVTEPDANGSIKFNTEGTRN